MSSRRVALVPWGVILAAVAGCAQPAYRLTEATGVVLHNGKPLDCGMVVLDSRETGYSACAVIQPDGTFTIGKVVAGEYRVRITAPELPPPGSGIPPTFVSEANRKLFEKYATTHKDGVKVTVSPDGNNTLRFEMP